MSGGAGGAAPDGDGTTLARLSLLPFLDRRTVRPPGLLPLDPRDWLRRDAAFGPQMALRDRFAAHARDDVFRVLPEAAAAEAEVLDLVRAALAADPGYREAGGAILRPDGVAVDLDGDHPLLVAGRLVQEDLCLMDRAGPAGEHRLVGGFLCFPSRWTLGEKMGRGLLGIHGPVPGYAEALGARVQRVFDAIRPEAPLWRANWLPHSEPDLHQPLREAEKRPRDFSAPVLWLRVERQTLRRLPRTGAVLFTIRTEVAPLASLTAAEGRGLAAAMRALPEPEFSYKGGAAFLARLAALFGEG